MASSASKPLPESSSPSTSGISNAGNVVNIFDNKVTGNMTTNIFQRTNKEPRTSLKYGLPLAQENVIGRDNDVAELYKLLTLPDHKPVVITGMGGLGKTTLAFHCAHVWSSGKQYENIQNIAVLNAETDATFKQSIKGFAKELYIQEENREIPEIMREIFNQFTKNGLLIVYDNVDAYSVVRGYLPENISNVYILATSQLTELRAFFNCYQLRVLCDVDSKTLVMNVFSQGKCSSHFNEEDMDKLVRVFGGLPLGLLQAAAYIKDIIENENTEYSIKDYMEQYDAHLNEPFPDDFRINYKHTVYIGLKMNIDKIKEESTKQILWCMSYLDPDNIETELFLQHFDENQVRKAVRDLIKYSIVKRNCFYENITIHRLLQEVCRKIIESEKIHYITIAIKMTVKLYELYRHCAFICSHIENDLLIQVFTEGLRQAFESGKLLDDLNNKLRQIELDESVLDHWNAWHFAAYFEWFHIFKEFREKKLIFEHKKYDWTPLHAAAHRDSLWGIRRTAKYLPKEFDINAQTSTGLTPLHISAALGYENTMIALIMFDCNVNIRDNQGNTPLHWIALTRNKDIDNLSIMNMLTYYGADINIINNNNQTALEIYEQVTNGISICETAVKCSQTIIVVTSTSVYGSQLRNYLISLDILINSTDGEQLVINKLNRCHWWNERQEKLVPELINLLFNARIALDIVTSYILNVNISLEEVINILKRNDQHTESEMFVNFTDSRYKNIYRVICMAIDRIERKSAFKFMSYLIYLSTGRYNRYLERASLRMPAEHTTILRRYSLLENKTIYFSMNDLIRHIAHVYLLKRKIAYSIMECVFHAELKWPTKFTPLWNFIHIKDIQLLFEQEYRYSSQIDNFIIKLRTFRCNIRSTENWSPLHYVCVDIRAFPQLFIVKIMLLKFDPNMSVNGITPMHLTAFRGYYDIVHILIAGRANVNVKTAEGITPLHLAYARGNSFTGLKLIRAGADINARDCKGNTPSHYAARYGSEDILRDLQELNADQSVNCNGETPADLLQRAKKS